MKQQLTIAEQSIKDIERATPGPASSNGSRRSGQIQAYKHAIEIIKDNVEFAEKQQQPSLRTYQKEMLYKVASMPYNLEYYLDFGKKLEDEILGNIFSVNTLTPEQEENFQLGRLVALREENQELLNMVDSYKVDVDQLNEENHNLHNTITSKNMDLDIANNENLMLKKANKECLNRMQQQGHQLQRLQDRLDNEKNFNNREINMLHSKLEQSYEALQAKLANEYTLKYVICFLALIIFFLLSSIGYNFYKS